MVLDADEKPLGLSQLLDLDRLGVREHQRLDRQHVLVVLQGHADDRVVQMVRHGHHHEVARRQLGDHLLEQVRMHLLGRRVERRERLEPLPGKRLGEPGILGQDPQRGEFRAQILIGPMTPCRCKWYSDGRIWSWVIIPPPTMTTSSFRLAFHWMPFGPWVPFAVARADARDSWATPMLLNRFAHRLFQHGDAFADASSGVTSGGAILTDAPP